MARAEAFPPRSVEEDSDLPPEVDTADFAGPDGTGFEFVTIRLREVASSADLSRIVAIATRIASTSQQQIRTEQRPIAIDNYAAVRSTPAVLAGLLGLMAAATLAHLVVSVVRRRRRDLALCVALGMGRAQVSCAVVVQALLVAGISMLVGLPLGLAAGRLSWAGFASDLGVAETLRLPIAAVGLVVPCVLAGRHGGGPRPSHPGGAVAIGPRAAERVTRRWRSLTPSTWQTAADICCRRPDSGVRGGASRRSRRAGTPRVAWRPSGRYRPALGLQLGPPAASGVANTTNCSKGGP